MTTTNTPARPLALQTTCPYCGVGCGVLVSKTPLPLDGGGAGGGGETRASSTRFTVRGDPDHPANRGRLCSKGAALAETLDLDERLLHPHIGHQRASWDAALDLVAAKFNAAIAEHGPESVAFYVSGQLLTEDYYVANKLMKGCIGTANIDTNSRLCMSSAVAAMKRAFGSDTVPACYEDLELADLVVLVGSNTAWAHPVAYQRLVAAKQARPEMRVVLIDPRRTATADVADLHLAIRPGADAWLFNGLLNHLAREGALNWPWLEAHVEGFGEALATVASLTLPEVARQCGLAESDVAEFFRLFRQTDKTVTLFSQGINQSSSGVDKGNAIINVHLATGRIGRPGAAPFSITGQPNAMGGREVGGLANQLAAHMDFAAADIDRVRRFWGVEKVADQPGLKAVDLFQAVAAGRIKALWIMATNPAVSAPEADRVAAALKQCDFVVVSDVVAQTDSSLHAHVRLPAAAWGEKDGTVTNSERCISRQRAFLPLPGEAKPDWWIVGEVARRMGHAAQFPYQGPADIFAEHAALSCFENSPPPPGEGLGERETTRDFTLAGLSHLESATYDALPPTRWPVTARGGTDRMFADGRFFTPSGRARMLAITPRAPVQAADAAHPYILNTGRIRDQWHTMTRTAMTARLFAHIGEPFVEIHPDDAARVKLAEGGLARLSNAHGDYLGRVKLSPEQRRGSVFAPMHWNDQFSSRARVDALIAAITDPISGQPEFKQTPVAVAPYASDWQGFVLLPSPIGVSSDLAGVVCPPSRMLSSSIRGAGGEGKALDSGLLANLPAYWSKIRGKACWRFELAGAGHPDLAALRGNREGHWIEMHDEAAGRHRGALLVAGRLAGLYFVERDPARLPPRHWLESLFEKEVLSEAERAALLLGRPLKDAPDCGRIVCACFGVGENDLKKAIAAGADTVAALGLQLKAGSNCGSCIPELKKLLPPGGSA